MDDLLSQVHMLETSKMRLETEMAQIKKEFRREIETKEDEDGKITAVSVARGAGIEPSRGRGRSTRRSSSRTARRARSSTH